MRRIALFLVLTTLAAPALAQEPEGRSYTLKEAITGSAGPLTMTLKDLNSDWRRMTVSGQFGMGGYMDALAAMFGGAASNFYYTRGDTVTIGGQTYIVAYRPESKPGNLFAAMQSGANKPPAPVPLTPDTILYLSLLDQRTSGSFTDIRPFDMKAEIAESAGAATGAAAGASAESSHTESVSRLRQVDLALLMYSQDYDETLPPMKDAATVKKALLPYVKNDSIFLDPAGRPYVPNSVLSYHKLAHIAKPAEMVVFYESDPAPDGTRAAAYLDGHVKRLTEGQWDLAKKQSKIPAKVP